MRGALALLWAMMLLMGVSLPVADGATSRPAATAPSQAVCSEKPQKGHFTCLSRRRTDTRRRSDLEALVPAVADPVVGYGPSDLQSAYNIPADAGSGATVAVIDAFDDPTAEADVGVYRAEFGLPACTTANGCFRKVGQTGGSPPAKDTTGWAGETALDIDMVSAACPLCHILLVEATTDAESDLAAAAGWAAGQSGVRAVSNSYGGSETGSDTAYGAYYYNHPGVAMVAAAGDNGYGVEFPAASPYVIAVGGTSLTAVCGGSTGTTCATGQRPWSETVWNGLAAKLGATGSGCSAYEPKPAWQHDSGCSHRTVADIAADADPTTGVAVYDTTGSAEAGGPAWGEFGGTSAAGPVVAAMIAEANIANPSASYAYVAANASGLNGVTSGTDSQSGCSPAYLCTAGIGYNGPTGQGTPNGLLALGGTGSTAYQLNVPACPSGNLLANAGFESGGTGWSQSSSKLIAKHTGTGKPHTGSWSALLDGTGHARTDTLSQKAGFSASCRTATVSFWLKINTAETTTAKYDTLVVTLGAATVGTWSNLQHSRYKNYLHVTVRITLPLDTYNAKTGATLFFNGKEDSSKQTSFVIDDVSITLN
ncbi:MAG TPA: S53 family peptidase [Sporichthyaceae bacterium]|nr:S53 family peptidase [Sporichthyaceae bacterium]